MSIFGEGVEKRVTGGQILIMTEGGLVLLPRAAQEPILETMTNAEYPLAGAVLTVGQFTTGRTVDLHIVMTWDYLAMLCGSMLAFGDLMPTGSADQFQALRDDARAEFRQRARDDGRSVW